MSNVNITSGSWIRQMQLASPKKNKINGHNHMLSINGDAQGRSVHRLIAFCSHGIRSMHLRAVQKRNVLLGFTVE